MAREEIFFDEETILSQSANVARLYQKYLSIYAVELEAYDMLKIKVDEIYGKLMRHYRIEDDVEWKNQSAVSSQVKSDPKYVKAVTAMYQSEVVMKWLEKTLVNIKDLSHNIRNYLEAKKLLSGRDY